MALTKVSHDLCLDVMELMMGLDGDVVDRHGHGVGNAPVSVFASKEGNTLQGQALPI